MLSSISLATSYPKSVGLHFTNVFNPFSVIRYDAIASISCGGHPCNVDTVAEFTISGVIASRSAFVKCSNLPRFFSRYSLHSLYIGVSEASIIPLMKLSTLGSLIPSRSYPTEMLNWKPSLPPRPNSFEITLSANQPLIYSSNAS